ncbi:MAG: HEPN domain-containing protein [Thermoguttaceae bacterium]
MSNTKKRKPSNAYMKFESVIKRSLGMIATCELVENLLTHSEGNQQNRNDHSDMIRAAVVLAIAALDSYFTNVFSEHLITYIKHYGPTEKMVHILKEAGVGTKCALELLTMERPYRRIRSIVVKHLARQVMQRTEAINKLFEAYGFKDFCADIQKATRRKQLISSIKKIISRRHKIVHEGDMNSHGKLQPISVSDTKKRILAIIKFVSKADELITLKVG